MTSPPSSGPSSGPPSGAALLHDADCGFCVRAAGWIQSLGCEVEKVSWQDYRDLAAHGITPEAASAELHLVLPDGGVVRGHEAIAGALRRSTYGVVRLVGRVLGARVLSPLAARAYGSLAAHRYQLPGGTPQCAIPASSTNETAA